MITPKGSGHGGEFVSLTSIRGLACLGVWFSHQGNPTQLHLDPTITVMGRVGVTTFFTLSGFLMTLAYNKCSFQQTQCSYAFWLRRLARIMPVYLLCLLISYNDYACVFSGTCNGWQTASLVLSPLTLQAFVPCGMNDWGGVTWSISVEMFCYLVFPAIVVRLHRCNSMQLYKVAAFCLAITTLPTVITALYSYSLFDAAYCALREFPMLRACDYTTGMVAAVLAMREVERRTAVETATGMSYEQQQPATMRAVGYVMRELPMLLMMLTVVITPMISIHSSQYFNTGNAITLITALMLYTLIVHNERGITGSVLQCRPLHQLGQVSYCFYLFHLQVIGQLQTVPELIGMMRALVWFLTSFGIACYLHQCVELPAYVYLSQISRKYATCDCSSKHREQMQQNQSLQQQHELTSLKIVHTDSKEISTSGHKESTQHLSASMLSEREHSPQSTQDLPQYQTQQQQQQQENEQLQQWRTSRSDSSSDIEAQSFVGECSSHPSHDYNSHRGSSSSTSFEHGWPVTVESQHK